MSSDFTFGITIDADAGRAKADVTSLSGSFSKLGEAGDKASGRIRSGFSDTQRSLSSLGGALDTLKSQFLGVASLYAGKEMLTGVVQASAQMDRLEGMMEAASGSAAVSADNMRFVAQTARTLGINLDGAAEGFASLTAATQGTALQGQVTRDIFQSVSQAAAALGKSSADTQGILLALSQMVSKGTVSMEELRGQLGERLPGAFRLAAQAMGVTTQTLDKLVSTGQITATELLPKLAKALDDTYAGARFDRINNQLARLDNAWLSIKATLVDSDVLAGMVGHLADALDGLSARSTPLDRTRERISSLRQELAALEKQMAKPWWDRPIDISLTGADQLAALRAQLSAEQNRLGGLEKLAAGTATPTAATPAKNAYLEAASAAWKLNEAQQAVAATIVKIAEAKGFDPAWLLSISKAETQLGALAQTSSKGAKGVFQFMDGTAARFGVKDPLNIEQAAGGAIQYLTLLQKQFDSTQLATAAYNAGEGNVAKYGNIVPPFRETQGYVSTVKTAMDQLNAAMGKQTEGWTTVKTAVNEANVAFKRMGDQEALTLQAAEQRKALTLDEIERKKLVLGVDEQLYKAQLDARSALEQDADRKRRLMDEAQAREAQFSQQSVALIQAQYAAQSAYVQAQLESVTRQLAGADQTQQSMDTVNGLKLKAVELENQLMLLTQQRSTAELAASSKASEYAQKANALRQDEVLKLQALSAELAYQQALYDKLNAAKQSGATTSQLGTLAATMDSLRGMEGPITDAHLAKVQEMVAATEALKQKNQELAGAEQAVSDEVLRANQYWDQYYARLERYASLWKEITGNQHDAFSESALAFGSMSKNLAQLKQQYDKGMFGKGGMAEATYGLESAQAALGGMAEAMLALRSNYETGSQGYKDMTAAAERMMEVQRALQVVEGVLAVIHQLSSGDVYTAIPRALGVAAMIASLGVSTGAAASRANGQTSEGGSSQQGGGVFGDPKASSGSIANSLKLVAQNSSADLSYSAAMLRSLQNIEYAMAGATNAVIRSAAPAQFSQPGQFVKGSTPGVPFNPHEALMNMLIKRSRELTDWGLTAGPQSLDSVLNQGFIGKVYSDITTKTKFLGITIGETMKTVYSAMDKSITGEFTRVIIGMADTLKEAGAAFGLNASAFNEQMQGFVINFGKVSLKGLKGADLEKAIQAMFSGIADDMARAWMPNLDAFQKVGEGYFETMVRVSHGINTASGLLAQLGVEAVRYTDILWKQGDVAAEIVRQSIVQAEGAATAIGRYMDTAVGSADDLIAVYQDLLAIKDMAPTLAFNLEALTQTMVVTSGGVSKLKDAMTRYLTGFFTQSEQMGVTYAALQRQFGNLGTTVPGSRQAFRDLVSSLDLTTDSGQKLYARLMSLADPLASFMDQLDQARQAFIEGFGTPTDQIQAQYKALKAEFNALGKAVPVSREAFVGLVNGIDRTTESGRLLRAQLMSLSAGLSEYFSRIEQIQTRYAPLTNPFAELEANLKTVNDDFALLLQATEDGQTQSRNRIDKLSRWIRNNVNQISNLETALAKEEGKRKPNEARLDRIRDQLVERQTNILAWQAEIDLLTAQSAADIDSVLEEQGLALVAALTSGWASVIAPIKAARKALDSQIAELQGTQAKADLAGSRLQTARTALALGGLTPAETVQQITDVQTALMDRYNAEVVLINETATAAQEKYAKELQAIKQISDYAKGMLLSGASTLSPEARLAESRSQYENLLQQARAGNTEAMSQLTGAADTYLQAAKDYYASSGAYQDAFASVYEALNTLGGTTLTDPVVAQTAAIDALKQETIAALEDLQTALTVPLSAAQDQMAVFITDFRSWMTQNHVDNAAVLAALAGLEQQTITARASGGYTPAGLTLVGEQGPELVNFTRPAQIYTAPETRSLLSGDPDIKAILQAIQRESKAQVTTQSAAYPKMIERLDALDARLGKIERNQKVLA